MFSWNENFIINIKEIDTQHQMLIATLQEVYEACSSGNGVSQSYKALKFLKWYVTKHFTDEEIIQEKCNYPYFEQHKKLHNLYREEVNMIIDNFNSYGGSSSVISQILVSFGTLIINHIRYEDVRFGEYVHSNKISVPNIKTEPYDRDPLTGLLSKESFDKLLSDHVDLIAGTTKEIAYIILDVDNFGIVNQSYGYEIGSELLIYISGILHDFSSDNIHISHRHGDIFSIFIIMDDNELDPMFIVNQIKHRIEHGFKQKGSLIPLSISAGIALLPLHCEHINLIIQKATIALDYAKASGKNTALMFEDWMYAVTLKNAKIMNLLQPYHVENYINIVFQPIYCAKTKKLIACESLLRMFDEDGVPISPVNFIPLAERNRTILDLGYLTIEKVCACLNCFINKSESFNYASINLSAIQLNDSHLITKLKQLISKYDIDPNYLAFEITESIFINNIEGVLEILKSLKQLGCKLLLDDFGSGYSSLTYLSHFDIDTLKMDKGFLADLLTATKPKIVMQAIINLAHDLGINVIAEGVELEEEFNLLTELGCDTIQGFLFSKPLSLAEFLNIL